ncbi:MAG: hypothetical protein IJ400_04870 [Clostridia bacterium]|nr:hypothetical protein [Clostridia bacterium]MBQ7761370.1 hypothetical protein [Clostridia bacterium]
MYIKPEYKLEIISSEDIMEFSPNDIATSTETFDFGEGEVEVTKGTSTADIKDLLF